VLRVRYGDYGMPDNYRALSGFRQAVRNIWLICLRRRSQKSRSMSWDMFQALTERPRLASPIPGRRERRDAGHPREEPGAGKPSAQICEGASRMAKLLDHDPSDAHGWPQSVQMC